MKERPIIFSAPMVRALLAGTKTQTRRVVRHLPLRYDSKSDSIYLDAKDLADPRCLALCPYGVIGDRLWVRETWQRAGGNTGYWYAATDSQADDGNSPVSRWKPSIHMPRAASRILLEIVSVHVERLNDISEGDAQAEGILETSPPLRDFRLEYADLWDSINGPGSWTTNPWVWVVEFKRAEGGAV